MRWPIHSLCPVCIWVSVIIVCPLIWYCSVRSARASIAEGKSGFGVGEFGSGQLWPGRRGGKGGVGRVRERERERGIKNILYA